MSDLIDMQKAIEALQKEIDKGKPPFNDTIGAVRCGVRLARNIIEDLPSAQPIAKDINVPCTDTISRQAAIDAFDGVKVNEENCTEYDIGYNDGIDFAVSRLSVLPSVQETKPAEWCTDCKEYDQERHCCPRWNRVIRNTVEEIKAEHLPSVQERKGRWIHDGSRWANRWVCSECGYRWFFECSHGAFCPNCGAKMEGAEDAGRNE